MIHNSDNKSDNSDWDFEDFEAVDFDVDTVEDIFEQRSTEPSSVDFDTMDFLGIFGDSEEKKVILDKILPKKMPKQRPKIKHPEITFENWGNVSIMAKDGALAITSLGRIEVIGRCDFDLPKTRLSKEDPFAKADKYAEEINGKGSGLGFSSFVHLAGIMLLSSTFNSVVEPLNGYDIDLIDYQKTVEVTGMNWAKRKSEANIVLNKYYLLHHLNLSEFGKWCIEMSRKEELSDTSGFLGSSYDMEDSPYTRSISNLHNSIMNLDYQQAEVLTNWTSKYFMEQEEFKLDTEVIESNVYKNIHGSAKSQYDGTKKLISPHKALCQRQPSSINVDDDMARCSIQVKVLLTNWDLARTTFHDQELDHDYIASSIEFAEHQPRPQKSKLTIDDYMLDYLMKYKTFQNIRIQSDLMMRITGSENCFFSVVHQVGIAWKRHQNEIAYHVIYYAFDKPEGCGTWAYLDGVWRSASFIVGLADIKFSSALLSRCITLVVSVMNNCHNNWLKMEQALIQVMYTWLDSSWFTTTLCSDFRFVTTGHMSGNDVRNLITRNLISNKPLRACDIMLLRLAENHFLSPKPSSLTPMFGFPLRFHCIEKDLALGMNWHIRKADHETNCCKKMLKGSLEEEKFRTNVVDYYNQQFKFMKKVQLGVATYIEYKTLLDQSPDTPAINVPFMAAMVWSSKDSLLGSSSNQTATNFSLNNMLSDRGMTNFDGLNYNAKKVVDEMTRHITEHKVEGPYSLLHSESKLGPKIPQVFGISAKDASKSDREISAMLRTMRCSQFFSECMQSTVSRTMPEDALLEQEKYCPMVRSISRCLNSKTRVYAMSEDRSFHSGNNHPEAMSLVSALIGRLCNIPNMISSSSIQRCWKHRYVVLPTGFCHLDRITPNKEENKEPMTWLKKDTLWVPRSRSKKITKVPYVKLYYHMMQGIQAVAAGVINTVYNTGIMRIVQNCTQAIKETYIITTSDDVGRVIVMEPGVRDQLKDLVVYRPLTMLKFSSQLNNWRKFVQVKNDGIVEVNNITTAACGMIPQTFIHSTLCLQPLNGESILVDIMNVISNSRQTIFWGDGPTLAMSSLVNGIRMIMSRWLVTRAQMNEITAIGLIPTTIEELIEGFFPRSRIALSGFLALNNEQQRIEVLTGIRSLYTSAIRKLRRKVDDDNDDVITTAVPVSFTFDLKRKMILSARKNQGRLRAAYSRPYSLAAKIAHVSMFMGFFKQDFGMDLTDYEKLRPPRVHAIFKPMYKNDRLPTSMGQSTVHYKQSEKIILSERLLKIHYRQLPVEEELLIINEPDENKFLQRMNELKCKRNIEGFSTTCPSGLPPVRFYGNQRFTYMQCFNFTVDVSPSDPIARKFSYNGIVVRDYKPMIWGGATLAEKDLIRCFGTGYLEDKRVAFYKEIKGKIEAIEIPESKEHFVKIKLPHKTNKVIYYLNSEDRSPIRDSDEENMSTFPGLSGDTIAILNYGSYLHTNNPSGFTTFQRIFKKLGSEYPWFNKELLPSFPHFGPKAREISGALFHFTGSRSIYNFKPKFEGVSEVFLDITTNEVKTIIFEEEALWT